MGPRSKKRAARFKGNTLAALADRRGDESSIAVGVRGQDAFPRHGRRRPDKSTTNYALHIWDCRDIGNSSALFAAVSRVTELARARYKLRRSVVP